MVHEELTRAWVYEHYLIYLYLSIADSDCIISNDELSNIRCRAFKALDEDRCSLLIKEVYKEFRAHTEEERRKYIKDNACKFLRTDSIRQKVINDLESNVHSKSEDSVEQVMFRFIRKAINNCSIPK